MKNFPELVYEYSLIEETCSISCAGWFSPHSALGAPPDSSILWVGGGTPPYRPPHSSVAASDRLCHSPGGDARCSVLLQRPDASCCQ